MEKINYPLNFFDPYGDDPTHSCCDGCGKVFDTQDLSRVGRPGDYEWLCDDCLEEEE